MDIRQLRYFIRVVELGSFSRAALVLGVAQPSLSRQVRLLEVELRQSLLIRHGRGVETTEAGKVLLELGRGILHQTERVHEELGKLGGTLAGRVSIGLPPTWAKLLVIPFTRLLQQEMPNARLSMTEGLSLGLRDAVLYGHLDLALLYDVAPIPELETLPLREEELFVVGSRAAEVVEESATLTLQQLARMPLVLPGRPNAIRMLLETELCTLGLKPSVALEVDGVSSILDLVTEGAGCAVLPFSAVQTSGRSGDFQCWRVHPRPLASRVVLATSARRPATQTQKAAFRLLAGLVRGMQAHEPKPQAIAASEAQG